MLSVALIAVACGPGTTSATAAPASRVGELDTIRARGTLIVAIRVEAPPPNRSAGDPAHQQKRALETAVAMLIARQIIGPSAKVELRSTGGDRLIPLEAGDVDIAMTADTTAARGRALISVPYAAGAVVLAAKDGSPVRRIEDIRGQVVAVGQDELGARDTAQAFLEERRIAATLDNYMGVNGATNALDAAKASALIGDRTGVAVVAHERSLVVVAQIAARPFAVATRKTAPELVSAINDALRAALASGEIRDAAAKASFPYEAP